MVAFKITAANRASTKELLLGSKNIERQFHRALPNPLVAMGQYGINSRTPRAEPLVMWAKLLHFVDPCLNATDYK